MSIAGPPVAASSGSAHKSAPQRAMDKLGLQRPMDLALHLPIRYEDETRVVPIAALRDAQVGQVEAVVVASQVQARGRRQWVVQVRDDSGALTLRFLNFYASHQKSLTVGARVRVRGETRVGIWGREMIHPSFKVVTESTPLPTTLTPVYPTTAQLPQAYLRKAIAAGLDRADLSERLPADLVPPGMVSLRAALLGLHRPAANASADLLEDRHQPAWQRLKFEELLAQQLSQLQARMERQRQRAPVFAAQHAGLQGKLLARLPFQLTAAQRRVIGEIAADLRRPTPMHRLLQGDVGSGKTIVAAAAATFAIEEGWQCALMAPTEILAEQHLRKLVGWLEPLGVEVAWLAGSRKGRSRTQMLERVADGQASLVVGTHAVIQEQVRFSRLGLAIIDEQHRFGVQQRLALRAKLASSTIEPHTLMMSATPIPRTLAMSLIADLDVSTIDELPPGRQPVVTKLFSDARREAVIERIRAEAAQGRQVYWVCPLIEESETLDLQNATATHAHLSQALAGHPVGLLHGRMPAADKARTMAEFTGGRLSVLVSTTVIEVGVDVANASLMVIEHAERFGLSQLHQLRGRVGRGAQTSTCVLLYGAALSDTAKSRLRAMLETGDGFEIARRDLQIRGPGEFLGARQSGAPMLRFADLEEDEALMLQARAAAETLMRRDPAAALDHVARWLGGRAQYLKA